MSVSCTGIGLYAAEIILDGFTSSSSSIGGAGRRAAARTVDESGGSAASSETVTGYCVAVFEES